MTRRPTTPPAPGRPPVEELSDVSWARVEKRLWTTLDREPWAGAHDVTERTARMSGPRRRWWLAAGALAVAAVIAFVAWPSPRSSTHALPSRVATGAASTDVSFGDATITVAPASAVLLTGDADRGVSIVLERGSADFAVAPRVDRPPFVIHAGAVQVRVIGTRFSVSRSGDDARVVVTHGEVEVVAWGRREVLLAGASWSSDGVREAAVGGSAPVTNPGDVAAAHLSPPPEPAPVAPAPGPRPVPAAAPPALVSPPSAPAGATAAREPVPENSPRERFEAAERLAVTDPAAALRMYREQASGNDAWAANALYAMAHLAFGQGNLELAKKTAMAYLRRFPGGKNAADAQALYERITGASP